MTTGLEQARRRSPSGALFPLAGKVSSSIYQVRFFVRL